MSVEYWQLDIQLCRHSYKTALRLTGDVTPLECCTVDGMQIFLNCCFVTHLFILKIRMLLLLAGSCSELARYVISQTSISVRPLHD